MAFSASRLLACAIGAATLAFAGAASAAPVLYNLTLTAQLHNGVAGGTGSFSIEGTTLQGVGNEYFRYSGSPDLLLSLEFVIDGKTFNKVDSGGIADQVFFMNGNLAGVTYQAIDGGNVLISLNAGALSYIYNDYTTGRYSIGTVTGVLAPAAVPEPASLAMLGLGLLGLGFAGRKRVTRTA